LFAGFVGLLVAGCESTSFSDRLRDRFGAVTPKVQTVEGDTRTVYFAAQKAFKQLDYNLVRSSLTGLRIEAASRINTSTVFRDSRQLIAFVEITQSGPAQSEVALRLVEQMEAPGLGGGNEFPLKEHGFYETYFAVLQQVLREETASAAAQKN
jgi:hypothetical protein